MANSERRNSPRKECVVPLRFRIVANGHSAKAEELAAEQQLQGRSGTDHLATLQGEAVNLSERGLYFTSHEKLSAGETLEMYFTLPRELTGRSPEQVRCISRVVHVEERADLRGAQGIGATVERFESMVPPRNWSN